MHRHPHSEIDRTEYLAAFTAWFGACRSSPDEHYQKIGAMEPAWISVVSEGIDLPVRARIADFCNAIRPRIDRGMYVSIAKSNLLARMIYAGEPLRTVPCPTHAGHWCGSASLSGCEHGCHGSGWLLPERAN